MPQTTPEDAYWGATDKELVAVRGSFEYYGRLCCGDTSARSTIPDDTWGIGAAQAALNDSRNFYRSVYNQIVHTPQSVSAYTGVSGALLVSEGV